MPRTSAQKASDKKYRSRFKYLQLRVDLELAEEVMARAEAGGETVQDFLMRALQAELGRRQDQQP